jgi:protease IV
MVSPDDRPRRGLFRRFFGFLFSIFALIGFLIVLAAVGGTLAWRYLRPEAPRIADASVLVLDFNDPLTKTGSGGPLSSLLLEDKTSLRDVLDGLQRAGDDPRIRGVIARVGADQHGLATVQELRDAVPAFRAKGKFAIAFAESFGEFGSGTRPYYLATAFDEVWLQPLGSVGLTGLRAESPFLKGTLEKLDIEPRFDHRSEYKSAMELFTEKRMTGPNREQIEAILKSASGQIVRDVAADRRLTEDEVRRLVDRGPFLTAEAEHARLVDRVGYRDEAFQRARERAGGDGKLIRLKSYLERAGRPNESGPTIALIYGVGAIQQGDSDDNPLTGNATMTSDRVARAFRMARADRDVRAVLFRVDSPGGSAVASETIWREAVRTRQAGKPVIVSMGDVAGSGGYYVAAGADKILAEPATLTGSIGVVAGKMLTEGFWEKLGVTWDAVQVGENAGILSMLKDFSPTEKQRFETFLDTVYAGFKERVAAGRHLAPDAVEQVARGRVWSGEDAKARGLVDELGGFDLALRRAKEAAGLAPDQAVTLKTFPPERELAEILLAHLAGRDERDEPPARSAPAAWLARIQVLMQRLEAATSSPDVLTMPVSDAGR